MTGNGVAQIVVFLLVVTALTPPLGAYIVPGARGPAHPGRVPGPRAGRARQRTACCASTRPGSRAGRPTPARCWRSASRASPLLYAILRLQGHLPLNPADYPGMSWYVAFNTAASFVTNTNWQFYVGRVDPLVPQPDGRARRAELRLGGRRHRGDGRGHPRASPGGAPARSATSGPTWCASRSTCCVPLAVVARPGARLAGRHPDVRRPGHVPDPRGADARHHRRRRRARHPDDLPRAGGVADRDQARRHQRRRLLQLELGGPVREPDPADQLPGDAAPSS